MQKKGDETMEKKSLVSLGTIFLSFLKIGLFTFGGGYAMMAMMQEEFVSKKQWITSDEMLDIVALSESTPGPVAINSATNIGSRLRGWWGSFVATTAEILPAFLIMYILSLFLNTFMEVPIVAAAFDGIQCAVAVLIVRAGISLFKDLKKNALSLCILISVTVLLLCIHVFSWTFSSLLFILAGALIGFMAGVLNRQKKEEKI